MEFLEDRRMMAVGDLRFVTYNVHATGDSFDRGSGLPSSSLGTLLQAIGNESVNGLARPIDLLGLQEVRTQLTTTADVVSQLNAIYGAGVYARGNTNGGSTAGSDTVGLVYNTQTLDLLGEQAIGVATTSGQPRQAMRYKLRPDGGSAATEFYVYVSHFKAGATGDDEDRRDVEAQAIRADANALGSANVIYVGDFNIQSSSDASFQTLVGAGNGQAFDPINRLGNWNNNNSFKDIFTQAPMNTPQSGFTGGGLDDRFDFQLISGELTDGVGLEYIANSYHTFGNNGSLNANSNINDPGNTALPGLANRTTILNLLTTVSDHLPVVADYRAISSSPSVQFTSTTQSVGEATTTITVNLQLSAAAQQNVSLPYTISGTATGGGVDYTQNSASPLIIPAGSLTAAITFTVANDLLDEANETIVVTLGTPTNAILGTNTVHTVTITDNDSPPTVQFSTVSQSVSESTATITVVAQLSAVSGLPITLPFSLSGSAIGGGVDYLLTGTNPLTIPAGSSSGAITLNVQDDTLNEADKTLIVTLTAPTNATLGAITTHTATIVDNDSLRVTAITPTATGFVAKFNGALNQSTLNLYDQNNAFGAADVTLMGSTFGSVRGSLLVNTTGDELTFVRTGGYDLATNSFGTLPPDNYSVSLSSGVNGINGQSGDQLDGNGDGTAGDDFSSTFTLAPNSESTVTLSVPDFARGFGQAVNLPADTTLGIPVTMSRGVGITSATFAVQYDPALLTITGATKGSGVTTNTVLSVDTSTPGIAIITLSSPTQLSFFNAPFTLVHLTASVPATAPYGEKQVVAITNATVSVGSVSLPLQLDDGVQVTAFFGDLDQSRTYNAADLPILQRMLTGAYSGLTPYRNADPTILADLNADGKVQLDDASLLHRLIQAAEVPTVPPLPTGIVTPPPTGTDPRIFVARDLLGQPGQFISVPIELLATDPTPITIAAADIALEYDPAALSFVGVRGGSLLGAQSQTYGPTRAGELQLHAWATQSPTELSQGQSGTLLFVDFLVSATATGPLAINLTSGGRVNTAVYDDELVSLVLQPTPTASSDDDIDGLITVLANEQEVLRVSRESTRLTNVPFGPLPLRTL